MMGGFYVKSNRVRTAGIVLAVALLFYLGGLICQIHLNYVQWMSDVGITGKTAMAPVRTGILDCWASGLSFTGLKYDLLIIVLAVGVYAFFRLQDRFGSKDRDARNFSRSKRGTYGTAGWMSDKEMRAILEVARARPEASYWARTNTAPSSACRRTPDSTSTSPCSAPAGR